VSVLAELITETDGTLSAHAAAEPGEGRFAGAVEDPTRLFVLEAVYEGYLMHYGSPRAFRGMDDDLRLLAGDALYALGLARLAEAGDIAAVAELCDLISLVARLHSEDRSQLADDLWEASARSLSAGGGPGARAVLGDRLGRMEPGSGREPL
jgi:hypothetical protein